MGPCPLHFPCSEFKGLTVSNPRWLLHFLTAPPFLPADHVGTLSVQLVVVDKGVVHRRRQISPPMPRMCQMLSHPLASRSPHLANVRSITVSTIYGINHTR